MHYILEQVYTIFGKVGLIVKFLSLIIFIPFAQNKVRGALKSKELKYVWQKNKKRKQSLGSGIETCSTCMSSESKEVYRVIGHPFIGHPIFFFFK